MPTKGQQIYSKGQRFYSLEVGEERRGKGGFGTDAMNNESLREQSKPIKRVQATVPVSSITTAPAGAGGKAAPATATVTGTSTAQIKLETKIGVAAASATGTAKPANPTHNRMTNQLPLPAEMFADGKYIFLNIGGYTRKEGWFNVNSQSQYIEFQDRKVQMDVDIYRLMHDLHGFPDRSVSCIYASHILEHSSLGSESGNPSLLIQTLREWYRVLRPGGLLMVAVPDLPTLFQLYLSPKITDLNDRWLLTRVIYGGQTDEYDYHKVGFDEPLLSHFIQFPFQPTKNEHATGLSAEFRKEDVATPAFCDITRVHSFQLFDDSSEITMFGKRISLNLAAKKCIEPGDTAAERAFSIDMVFPIPFKRDDYAFPHEEICAACRSSNRYDDENGSDIASDEGKNEEEGEEEEEEEMIRPRKRLQRRRRWVKGLI